MSVIIFPGEAGSFLTFYDELAHLSGGRAHVVKDESVMQKYLKIIRALHDINDDSNSAVIIHQEITNVTDSTVESSGTFLIDSSLGRNTQFGILVEDEEDHLIQSIHLTDEKGEQFGPFTHLASTFDNINMKTINFGLTAVQPLRGSAHLCAEWKYRIAWHKPPGLGREAAVVVSSQPRSAGAESGYLISMWTHSDMTVDIIPPGSPLVMYVAVRKGSSPVLRASVQVVIDIVYLTMAMVILIFLVMMECTADTW